MSAATTDRPILVMGSAGQVGAVLAARLAAVAPVVAATRADADLERPAEIRELVARIRPRLIVNAAAYTAVDDAERSRGKSRRVNAEAPGVLAEAAASLRAPIVHFSTNYVFDGAAHLPYEEESPARPLSVYGHDKLLGEQLVSAANPAHLILRIAGVYGWTARNFMLRIMSLAKDREELRVVDDQLVAPTSVSSLADAVVRAIRQLATATSSGAEFGTFHLTSAGATTWFHFAERILAPAPGRPPYRARLVAVTSDELAAPADRPPNGLLNCDKFARQFGVALPEWDLDLDRTLARGAESPSMARPG